MCSSRHLQSISLGFFWLNSLPLLHLDGSETIHAFAAVLTDYLDPLYELEGQHSTWTRIKPLVEGCYRLTCFIQSRMKSISYLTIGLLCVTILGTLVSA